MQCHGEKGEGNAEKFYPWSWASTTLTTWWRQFEWIRDGKRRNANPDMVKQIKEFTDADMKAVINYVSRMPVPEQMAAPVKDLPEPDFK